MLHRSTYSLITFSGHSKPLDKWLQHRQLLVSGYCHMIANTLSVTLPPVAEVKYWCAELVDYLTAGHFQVFTELLEHMQKESNENFEYESLIETTNQLLSLQEAVFEISDDNSKSLEGVLSNLGELLAKRLEIEDLFISSALKPQAA